MTHGDHPDDIRRRGKSMGQQERLCCPMQPFIKCPEGDVVEHGGHE